MRSVLVFLAVLGWVSATPVNDASTFVESIVKSVLNPKIPDEVIAQWKENIPAKINIKVPNDMKKIENLKAVGAVDPNAVTDEMLKEVDATVKSSGIDPYTLASFNFLGFSIVLTVGSFDTLHRNGDFTMIIFDTFNYEFQGDVQVYSLTGDFALSFTFLGFDYNAGVNCLVDTVDADTDYSVSINPANNATYIIVNSLDTNAIGRISVEVTGLGPLDPFANAIANIFLNVFKGFIPIFFDGIFLNICNQILNELYPPWQ